LEGSEGLEGKSYRKSRSRSFAEWFYVCMYVCMYRYIIWGVMDEMMVLFSFNGVCICIYIYIYIYVRDLVRFRW
jgi:hypothetical protein